MGQISVEIYNPPGSTLSDNQHFRMTGSSRLVADTKRNIKRADARECCYEENYPYTNQDVLYNPTKPKICTENTHNTHAESHKSV